MTYTWNCIILVSKEFHTSTIHNKYSINEKYKANPTWKIYMGSRKNVFLVLPCLLLLLKTKNSSKSQHWRNSHYIVKGKFTKYSRTLQSPIIGNLLKFLLYKTIANISLLNRFIFALIPLHGIKSKYLRDLHRIKPIYVRELHGIICKRFT